MTELKRMAQRRHLSTGNGVSHETTVEAQDNECWEVPIEATVATSGKGIEDVINAIEVHQTFLSTPDTGVQSHRARIQTSERDRRSHDGLKR
ncbi:MAG: putative periplasmic protein kinase ArgK related GTPases of G3E family [Haloquadratum sp. J07HQX50]|jgi:ArgK protein.|nr:MAG: putative periplasmic protein kinase ArgK related GTPases of G3E family [Haloquadratum sp. J07HQX50]